MYYVASLLSLAFLIIVHEAGHYFVARWCGMRVERFSIGFGPGILKRTSKKTGTVFQIAPIPFGGFVEIRGMNIAEEVDPDDHHAYPNRPAWQRFVTIFAGPATNYLSAMVLVFGLYMCHGGNSAWRWHEVASIKDGFDAKGKLEIGDRIIAVDKVPIIARGSYTAPDGTQYTEDSLTRRVNEKKGQPFTLTVLRDGKRVDVTITPKLVFQLRAEQVPAKQSIESSYVGSDKQGNVTDKPQLVFKLVIEDAYYIETIKPTYLIGIGPIERADVLDVGIVGATVGAFKYPIEKTKMIAGGLYDIFRGKEEADPGGPKRIFDEFSKAWQLGIVTGIELLAILSVYLGLFNLFPLPALDGGRLVFLTYELVTRRRANPKIEAMVHMAGIMVLGVVMILVTLNDFHVF